MNYDPAPPPLEQTDAALAEQFQLIASGQHPTIRSIGVERDCIRTVMHDGTVKIKKVALPGRNEPCSCGSGKKYKKCCGR
jgi:uncharacterized protein YecA (UPF0149 family)